MFDPTNRAMMTDFYRLFEQFETLTDATDTDRWKAIADLCCELDAKYSDLVFRHILMGYLAGMEERARQARQTQ